VKTARVAGAVYLSTLPLALYFWSYIPGKLVVRGNATATAENILAHETLFRVSILGDLVGHVIFICLGFLLYRLLCDVNRLWALAMLGFVLVSGAVGFLNALNSIAAVIVACFAWLVLSISELLSPGSSSAISEPLQLVTLGEMAIALWFLIRGANVSALPAQAV
jgi:uncharacterized protein DUF4386